MSKIEYEMKCYMKKHALTKENVLSEEVMNAFSIVPGTEYNMNIMYLDNEELLLNSLGWTIRARKKATSSKFEYTYKKRFSAQGDTDFVIDGLFAENLITLNPLYSIEMDCVGAKKVLSNSNETKVAVANVSGIDFPEFEVTLTNAIKYAPAQLLSNVTTAINDLKAHGPILATRYSGIFGDMPVTIEVWNIAGDYITEVSFKTTDTMVAYDKKEELSNYLRSKGLLLNEEILKTQLVLEKC